LVGVEHAHRYGDEVAEAGEPDVYIAIHFSDKQNVMYSTIIGGIDSGLYPGYPISNIELFISISD
jgi:hypothetical protein